MQEVVFLYIRYIRAPVFHILPCLRFDSLWIWRMELMTFPGRSVFAPCSAVSAQSNPQPYTARVPLIHRISVAGMCICICTFSVGVQQRESRARWQDVGIICHFQFRVGVLTYGFCANHANMYDFVFVCLYFFLCSVNTPAYFQQFMRTFNRSHVTGVRCLPPAERAQGFPFFSRSSLRARAKRVTWRHFGISTTTTPTYLRVPSNTCLKAISMEICMLYLHI